MLPLLTTAQVQSASISASTTNSVETTKSEIDSASLMIDLSEYMKKKDAATKEELQKIEDELANKVDKTVNDCVSIVDNDDSYKILVNEDTGELNIVYNENVIARYVKTSNCWRFNGIDLDVLDSKLDNVCSDIKNLETKVDESTTNVSSIIVEIESLQANLNTFITETNAILKNHFDALVELCQEHNMIDSTKGLSDNSDSNIIPTYPTV